MVSGLLFAASLGCLYFAASGYQIAVIQDQLISQVQKQAAVQDLVSDPRFKQILSSDDAATKLILASATSLEDEQNSEGQVSAFSDFEKRKMTVANNSASAELFDHVINDYRTWQTAKQTLTGAQAALSGIAIEKEQVAAGYKLLVEDVEALFQTKPHAAAESAAPAIEAANDTEDESPFNIYRTGLLAGIPRVAGVPDDITDQNDIVSLLRQPVDQAEPPSVKVERFRSQMADLSAKYNEISARKDKVTEQIEALDTQTDSLRSNLRTDLFRLLSASHRSRLDNGALRVYQEISSRFPA